MNRSTLRRAALPAALALSLGLAACSGANEQTAPAAAGSASGAAELSGDLNGAGASSQTAAQQAWIAAFTATAPDVTVNYDPAGSGAGRKQFLSGGAAFAGSDAALKDEELASAKERCAGADAFDVPVYVSPIAVAYNLPGVDDLKLSGETTAKLFNGTITTWNDPAVAADNPGVALPATKVNAVHRSDDSGTTENFTDYLHAVAPDAWTAEADGVWPLQSGEAAQGTSGVVSAIAAGEGSVGYADESQVKANTALKAASIKVGEQFVGPTPEAAAAALDAAKPVEGRPAGDVALELDRTTTAAGAYPVVLVSYAVACTSYPDAADAAKVKAYLTYITSAEGQQAAAAAAGSAPISDTLRQQITPVLEKIGA